MKNVLIILLGVLGFGVFSQNLSMEDISKEVFKPSDLVLEKVYQETDKAVIKDYSFEIEGFKEYALISVPKTPRPEKGYPVIILIHGYINPSSYSTFNNYTFMFSRYSNSEFIVVKPDLRGHGRSQKGVNHRDSLSHIYYMRDVLKLIATLENLEGADTNNIFLMGHSNGGNQALRIITAKPDLIRAASLWAPTSVELEYANFFWKGGGKKKFGDTALIEEKAKPYIEKEINTIKKDLSDLGNYKIQDLYMEPYYKFIRTPITIRHPDTDESVPYSWSKDLVKKIKTTGNKVYIDFVNYPGDNHNIANNQFDAQMADLKWFRGLIAP